jgi:hypothetical protein
MMSRGGAISGAASESAPEESLVELGGHRSEDEHATRSIAELVVALRPPVPARLSRADVGLPMTSPPPARSAPRANAVRAPRPRPRSFALARPDHHHATAEDDR